LIVLGGKKLAISDCIFKPLSTMPKCWYLPPIFNASAPTPTASLPL